LEPYVIRDSALKELQMPLKGKCFLLENF